MYNVKTCSLCKIETIKVSIINLKVLPKVYNTYNFNNKNYCSQCIISKTLYRKKYCFNCKNILKNNMEWFYINDNVYCSDICQSLNNKNNIIYL